MSVIPKKSMTKAFKGIKNYFYPAISLVSTVALVGLFLQLDAALSNNAQSAQMAKNHNSCVNKMMALTIEAKSKITVNIGIAEAVHYCNGGWAKIYKK